ncbi:MAG: AAA family ATPase [Patescibacteria group bacterium]|nr:AAA family ATPase [Patescibacteria group bacterium]
MIYLIGGPPRCGKTTLAERLTREMGMSFISADTLENIAYRYTRQEDVPRLFPKTMMRRGEGKSSDVMYSRHSAGQIAQAYIAQSSVTRNAILAVAESSVIDGVNVAIEGHQIHPSVMAELTELHGSQMVRSLVLLRRDVEKCVADCRKSTAEHDWFIRKAQRPETHLLIARMIVKYGKFFEVEADQYHIPTQELDEDFFAGMEKAFQILAR